MLPRWVYGQLKLCFGLKFDVIAGLMLGSIHLLNPFWLPGTLAIQLLVIIFFLQVGYLSVVFLLSADNAKCVGRNVQRSSLHHELAWRLCKGQTASMKR